MAYIYLVLCSWVVCVLSFSCSGVTYDDVNVCSRHVVCESEDSCQCYAGFVGPTCSEVVFAEYITGKTDGEESVIFGTKGEYDSGNRPGGSRDHNLITSPIFPESIFRFYGYSTTRTSGLIWEYNTTLGQWRYINGNTDSEAIITRGGDSTIFDDANFAGARTCGFAFLSQDGQGVYVGNGYSYDSNVYRRNDMWLFNLTLLQWRQFSFSAAANKGTTGVFSAAVKIKGGANWGSNYGAKRNATRFVMGPCMDGADVYWIDLYEFDEPLEMWRHVKGLDIGNYVGNYVSQGDEDLSYYPAARRNPSEWSPNEDEYWVFGGVTSIAWVRSNDLWRYRFSSNCWTWISGPQPSAAQQSYSLPYPGEFHEDNLPASCVYCGGFTLGNHYLVHFYPYEDYTRGLIWVYSIRKRGWMLSYGDPALNDPQNDPPYIFGNHYTSAISLGHSDHSGSRVIMGGSQANSGEKFMNDVWNIFDYFCYDKHRNDSDVCNGTGHCVDVDSCSCFYGSLGDECEISLICFGHEATDTQFVCSSHGSCVSENVCECDEHYVSPDCSVLSYFEHIRGNVTSTGVPAVIGCDSETSSPGSRGEGCGFAFRNGYAYIFGGKSTNYNYRNDVWRLSLSPDSSTWCYISGNSSFDVLENQIQTEGTFHSLNQVGSRSSFAAFATEFSFLVFGGRKQETNNTNELWEFQVVGDNTRHQWRILYEEDDNPSDEQQPTKRSSMCNTSPFSDINSQGQRLVYIFGGELEQNGGYLNDLWVYNLDLNTFTKLMNGSIGNIGDAIDPALEGVVINQFNSSLSPPHRSGHICWLNQDHDLFVFGGIYTSERSGNDVWIYNRTRSEWAMLIEEQMEQSSIPINLPMNILSISIMVIIFLLSEIPW